MNRRFLFRMTVLLLVLVGAGYWAFAPATGLHDSVNRPGELFEPEEYFEPGVQNIIYFYADW